MCPPKVSISLNVGTFNFFFPKMPSTVIPATINSDSGKNLAGVRHEFVGIRRNLASFGFFFFFPLSFSDLFRA